MLFPVRGEHPELIPALVVDFLVASRLITPHLFGPVLPLAFFSLSFSLLQHGAGCHDAADNGRQNVADLLFLGLDPLGLSAIQIGRDRYPEKAGRGEAGLMMVWVGGPGFLIF